MSELTVFAYESSAVRTIIQGDDPWFAATDVAKILGYKLATDMLKMLDDDEKGMHILHTLGGDQELSVISESGLYAATLKSRKPEAKKFRKWVTSEVLPSIRKTGGYSAVPPAPTFTAVDHRADVLVSADRTFRAVLRSARAAGARLPAALARANAVTVQETGIDMLAVVGPVERPVSDLADPVADGISAWAKDAGDGPYSMTEILRQAFGLEPEARDYGRVTVQAGSALRAAGFASRKMRISGPLRSYWERRRPLV